MVDTHRAWGNETQNGLKINNFLEAHGAAVKSHPCCVPQNQMPYSSCRAEVIGREALGRKSCLTRYSWEMLLNSTPLVGSSRTVTEQRL